MKQEEFVKHIDHSLLKPELTRTDYIEGLNYAKELGVASVCINPHRLDLAREILADSDVVIGTVIGFPSGAHTTRSKVFEAIEAYANGARELDMVIDVGALKDGNYDRVREDIKSVVEATPACVKVILENAYLTDEEIAKGSELVEEAGADFVKTSTGFAASGSKVEDIKIMRQSVSDKVKVKAAGGLSTYEDCLAAIEAGADRVGISRTKKILEQMNSSSS